VSPFRNARDEVRQSSVADGLGFLEVYVSVTRTSLMERKAALYQRALRGELGKFTGLTDPYEPPVAAELVLQTDRETLGDCTSRLAQEVASHLRR
jgi:adenylylsulfate kinase-like enzyme